jgi:signal transduction histidine kinase
VSRGSSESRDALRASAFGYVDGGRSTVVRRSLERLLHEIRERLGADIALILYQGASLGEAYVLAAAADDDGELPLSNEPLLLSSTFATRRPHSRQDLVLVSPVRDYRIELVSALILPWSHRAGRGWLVAGMKPGAWNSGTFDLTIARGYASRLRQAHQLAGLRGTSQLQRDIARAAQRLAEAEIEATDVNGVLQAIAITARELLGTSAAYISLPEPDGQRFAFTTFVNVHTSPFRRLRMGFGQGLGGLAREEQRPIRSLNYAHDERLRDAPVEETLNEGFLSAMATPLMIGNEVIGLVYVANRHLTPFTETDTALLEEFAGYATLGIKHAQAERHRLDVMRRLEQERLAFEIHDSVVRALVEVGFRAETGLNIAEDPRLKQQFEAVGRAAEVCLEKIREQIAQLWSESETGERPLGEVVAALKTAHSPRSIPRAFHVEDVVLERGLAHDVASALVHIGDEALRNADLHSDGSRVEVRLEAGDDEITLLIADDGRGMQAATLSNWVDEPRGHLGLRRMRAAATDVGGSLTIRPNEGGGLCVEARVPLRNQGGIRAHPG